MGSWVLHRWLYRVTLKGPISAATSLLMNEYVKGRSAGEKENIKLGCPLETKIRPPYFDQYYVDSTITCFNIY